MAKTIKWNILIIIERYFWYTLTNLFIYTYFFKLIRNSLKIIFLFPFSNIKQPPYF